MMKKGIVPKLFLNLARFLFKGYEKIGFQAVFLSALSGILISLSFPLFNLSSLAWVALVPLFIAIENKPSRKAFFLGWIAGTTHFISLLHWLTVSMVQYGNLSTITSLFLLLLLSLYLGLYIGLWGGALAFFRSRYLPESVIIAPAIWTVLEYLRAHLFSGFPWGLWGYSQYQNLSVIQISDITGVYGVSFLILLSNSTIYLIIKWVRFRSSTFPYRYALFTVIIFLAVITYGTVRKNTIHSLSRESSHKVVHLIQGNIEQNQKWDPSYLNKTLCIHKNLTLAAVQGHSDLVVWPESAVPCYFTAELNSGSLIQKLADLIEAPIIFGSLSRQSQSSDPDILAYFNSAFLSLPHKKILHQYNKTHLVPFGEYVPLRFLFPFAEKMVEGIGDFSPGCRYTLFPIPQAKFGVLICYEVIFPDISRKYSQAGADFLVSITNDAWFGRTGAPYQHFSMAVFRAVENRVSLIRAANSGISGIISPTGKIEAQTPLFVRTFLQGLIPINHPHPTTFYSRYGDVSVGLCGIIIALVVLFRGTKKRWFV